jgi:hypothetical protein
LAEEDFVVTEPFLMEDGEDGYSWCLVVKGENSSEDETPTDGDIDITVGFVVGCEEDFENQINFKMDVVEYGGRIIGTFIPYNYTDKCWVNADDEDAVKERWDIFEHGCENDKIEASIRN